jgi:hypothetical protein
MKKIIAYISFFIGALGMFLAVSIAILSTPFISLYERLTDQDE